MIVKITIIKKLKYDIILKNDARINIEYKRGYFKNIENFKKNIKKKINLKNNKMEILSEENTELIFVQPLTKTIKNIDREVEKNKFTRVFYIKCYYLGLLSPKLFRLFSKSESENLKDSKYYSIDLIKEVCESKLDTSYTLYISHREKEIIIAVILIIYEKYNLDLPDIILKNKDSEGTIYQKVYKELYDGDNSLDIILKRQYKGSKKKNLLNHEYNNIYFLRRYFMIKDGKLKEETDLYTTHKTQISNLYNKFDYLDDEDDISTTYRWLNPILMYYLTYLKMYCDYIVFGITFFSASFTQYFLYLKRESVDREMKLENIAKYFLEGTINLFPSFMKIAKKQKNDLILRQYFFAAIMYSQVMETDINLILNKVKMQDNMVLLFKDVQINYKKLFKETVYLEILDNYNYLKREKEILIKDDLLNYKIFIDNISLLTEATWLNTYSIKNKDFKNNPFFSEEKNEISQKEYIDFFKITHFIPNEKKLLLYKKVVKCYGNNTGFVDAFIFTDIEGSMFFWRNSDSSIYEKKIVSRLNNLGPDLYTLTVVDKQDNIIEDSIIIKQPNLPINLVIQKKNISCENNSNGEIYIKVNGGRGPYKYFINGDEIKINKIKNLKEGIYNIVVKDFNGCTKSEAITITKPKIELDYILNYKDTVNGEKNGEINVRYVGGEGPYIINWTHSDNLKNIWELKGLAVGVYNFKITDATGCKKEGLVNLNNGPYSKNGSVFGNNVLINEIVVTNSKRNQDMKFSCLESLTVSELIEEIDKKKTNALDIKKPGSLIILVYWKLIKLLLHLLTFYTF